MKRRSKVLAGLLVVGVLAGACGGDSGGTEEATDSGASAGGESVSVSASDFAFSPDSLTAVVGDTIEFANDDDAKHSFTAEEAGIDEDAEAGESVSIDLGGVEAGSYDFICKYHPEMKGTLEVTG